MNKPELLETINHMFLQHIIQIKMYHFQTKSFSAHKASDSYFEKLNENFDKFMEVAQGIYGKLTTPHINIDFDVWTDDTITFNIQLFVKTLMALNGGISNSDLLNIRDEMVSDANQLLYLLTFK